MKSPGGDLFSHTLARAVSKALKHFTTVFEMGTGGTVLLKPPREYHYILLENIWQ